MPPGPRPSSCLRCRKDRKRCIRLESASCERCLTLGPSVECRFPPSKTDSSENEEVAVVRLSSESSGNQAQESSASPPHGQLQSPVVLAQIMHAFEDPFTAIKHQEARTSSEVEDIDLIGTFADYILLQRFYSEASESQMILMSIDIFGFLKNFFREPAPLRLVLGAIAARFVKPPVPEEVSFSYYRRARKAVMRVADEPSLRTVQAFYWIRGFSVWKGQPELGKPFLKIAAQMALQLRLDVDPDDSPWLYHLNLSELQKEERRRCFWACRHSLKEDQCLSDEAIPLNLVPHSGLKHPQPIIDPYPVFCSFDSYPQLCGAYDLITSIKRHYGTTPKSVNDVLISSAWILLNSLALSLQSTMPSQYILLAERPEVILPTDNTRFLSQIAMMPIREIPYIISLNLNILTSACLLHRAKMYLSHLRAFSNPHSLNNEVRSIILISLNECLESAHRIAGILSFLLDLKNANQVPYIGTATIAYPLFEAMIVFWFVSCRMDPQWWVYINRGSELRVAMKARWEQMAKRVALISKLQHSLGGNLVPLTNCVEAMYREIVAVEKNGGLHLRSDDDDMDALVLGMQVTSLGGDSNSQEQVVKDPWAFLGLLGLQVAGGIRWKGRSEEAWRLFWKLYG